MGDDKDTIKILITNQPCQLRERWEVKNSQYSLRNLGERLAFAGEFYSWINENINTIKILITNRPCQLRKRGEFKNLQYSLGNLGERLAFAGEFY